MATIEIYKQVDEQFFTHRRGILFILSEWLWKHKNQQYFVGEKIESKFNHPQLEDEP